jgi:hypothetical protein
MTREQELTLIYRHMHRDFKGRIDGERTIMIARGTTTLVALSELTDAEIADLLPYALKKEAQRKEKKG